MDSVPTRLAAFLIGLIALFGAAFGVGRAVGPIGSDQSTSDPSSSTSTTTIGHSDHSGSDTRGGQGGQGGTPTEGGHG